MREIGTASVIRHGATRYTDIFPDLLPEGLPIVRETARHIARNFPRKPVFISSPANRAVGTLMHVMEAYGLEHDRNAVRIEKLLGPIDIFDHDPVKEHFRRLTGHVEDPLDVHRVFDRFYIGSDEYETGGFCEPRSSAKRRFAIFLEQLPLLVDTQRHIVAATHLELLGTTLLDWFGEDQETVLRPGEAAHFTFFENGSFDAEFRMRRKRIDRA